MINLREKLADVIRMAGVTLTPGELADALMVVITETVRADVAESGRRAAERDHLRAEVARLRGQILADLANDGLGAE